MSQQEGLLFYMRIGFTRRQAIAPFRRGGYHAARTTPNDSVGGGVLDAPCGATYIVLLRPGDKQKSMFYRRGVEGAAPYN